jgi:uncharacterized protein YdaT
MVPNTDANPPVLEIEMTKRNQHVVPHDGGWAVKGAGSARATVVVDTQKEAIDRARDIARNQGTELLVHSRDGRIRERDSHGSDPFPPKG